MIKDISKQRVVETKLRQIFTDFGFDEIITPLLERYEEIKPALPTELDKRLYRLIDKNGEVLVLRGDITLQICKYIIPKENKPYKFFYLQPIFRYLQEEDKVIKIESSLVSHESWQVGAEIISTCADIKEEEEEEEEKEKIIEEIEIIKLLILLLKKLGILSFVIDISDIRFSRSVIENISAPKMTKDRLIEALHKKKDISMIRYIIDGLDIDDRRSIEVLFNLYGVWEEVLEKTKEMSVDLPEVARSAISSLAKIYEFIKNEGLSEYIMINLTTTRELGYYTSFIFEVYIKGEGRSIGGGGRYNELLKRFNKSGGGVGFALDFDRLLKYIDTNSLFKTSN